MREDKRTWGKREQDEGGEKKRCALAKTNLELYRRDDAYENPMSLVRLGATLHRTSAAWKPRPRQSP